MNLSTLNPESFCRIAFLWACFNAAGSEPVVPAGPALVVEQPRQWSLTARWENDTFGGTDRFYTDGASLSLIHTGGGWLDGFANCLPWGEGRRCVGYDFGQIMVTPGDKSLVVPDPDDRPYAGLLYLGLSLYIDHGNTYHGLKFVTGVVGPGSLAEETQKEVHRWVDSQQAQGWDYQLHNEPIFNLLYEQRRKYTLLGSSAGLALEVIPIGSGMLGNVLTQAQLGGQVRFGYRIPDDFGGTLLRGMSHLPPPRLAADPQERPGFGVFFYAGVHGRLVLHNITLDGNTWGDSPSVDREPFVPVGELGMGVATRRVLASFSYVYLGEEFEGQRDTSEFGAFTVTYIF